MLKFIAAVLIVLVIVFVLILRHTPRRPPRDWRHGGDDGGPVLPASTIDVDRKPGSHEPSGGSGDPVSADSGGDGGGGGSSGGD